jgi:hypothetical protein
VPIQLNHTIAGSRDAVAGAKFLTEMLGLPEATRFGPFQVVEISNGVSIDFMDYGRHSVIRPYDTQGTTAG